MAEGSSNTNKLLAKTAQLLATQSAWIALDKGNMDSFGAATNALATEATEAGVARTAATVSNVTTTVTNDTNRFTVTFSVGAAVAITGSGVLSASIAGDLWAWHRWPGVVNATVGDTLIVTFDNKQVAAA